MRKATITIMVGVLALTVLFGAMASGGVKAATNQPLYAPTPVSVTHPSTLAPEMYTLMNAVITADTRGTCQPIGAYSIADIEYTVDQSTTNTTTLTLQYSNNGVAFTDGAAIVTSNAADATGMNQYPVFGRLTCLFADVTNTNPVTVSVSAWVK